MLSYNDITLVPEMGIVGSRSECCTFVNFLGHTFQMPVAPANMRCSIDFEKANWCAENSYFYALHRFYDYEDILEWLRQSRYTNGVKSISVGVHDKDRAFLSKIAKYELPLDFVTIDVALGHSLKVKNMLEFIHGVSWRLKKPKIIVGNVATLKAVCDLELWGADAVKVGIGQGAVCSTRLQTGFGLPMFSCVQDCCSGSHIPIIADGGIKYYGDVPKALVAGATMVMVGSMFARCKDSPAESFYKTETRQTEFGPMVHNTGPLMKRWYGSASEHNKGERKHVEGILMEETSNGLTYEEMYAEWKEALQSAISYGGGRDLSCFKKVDYHY